MRLRPPLALLALLAVAVALPAPAADARKPRQAKRLLAFDSCDQLVDYAGRHIPLPAEPPVGPPVVAPEAPVSGGDPGGGEVPQPAPLAPQAPLPAEGGAPDAGDGGELGEDTSGTNNQEAGVHEPD